MQNLIGISVIDVNASVGRLVVSAAVRGELEGVVGLFWKVVGDLCGVVVGTGILGSWVETKTSGRAEDGGISACLVVVDCPVKMAVDAAAVFGEGAATGAVVVVIRGLAADVLARSRLLADVAKLGDVLAGETACEPTVVDLRVTTEGFVAIVTLAVTGLIAADVILKGTLVVTGTLGVAVRVDVLTMVGVALEEDPTWVVTLSRTVDTPRAGAEVVVWCKYQDGKGVLGVVVGTLAVSG